MKACEPGSYWGQMGEEVKLFYCNFKQYCFLPLDLEGWALASEEIAREETSWNLLPKKEKK